MRKKINLVSFLFYVVGTSCLVMAMMQALVQYLPDPRRDEVDSFASKIITVPADEVPSLLTRADGKPVMLIVYASWCPYCGKTLPEIMSLMRDRRLGAVTPVFLSVDQAPRKLAFYLVHHDYLTWVKPAYILTGDGTELADILAPAGAHFTGRIPYIGIFEHGKLTREWAGQTGKDELVAAVKPSSK